MADYQIPGGPVVPSTAVGQVPGGAFFTGAATAVVGTLAAAAGAYGVTGVAATLVHAAGTVGHPWLVDRQMRA